MYLTFRRGFFVEIMVLHSVTHQCLFPSFIYYIYLYSYCCRIVVTKFLSDASYRNSFTTCAKDRPLFVQLAGDDPLTLLDVAKQVEKNCDAIDINFGCPQVLIYQLKLFYSLTIFPRNMQK